VDIFSCDSLCFYSTRHQATIQTIKEQFPNALTNQELLALIEQSLAKYKYNKETPCLVATCLCSCCGKKQRRPLLQDDLATLFGGMESEAFDMGGLAGFAFGGITSFKLMSRHIPNGGNCVRL
jgi:hypothetical protein